MELTVLDAGTFKDLQNHRRALQLFINLTYTEFQNDTTLNVEHLKRNFRQLTDIQKRITSHLLALDAGDQADRDILEHQRLADKVEKMIAKNSKKLDEEEQEERPVKMAKTTHCSVNLKSLQSRIKALEPFTRLDDYESIKVLQNILEEACLVADEPFQRDIVNRAFALMPTSLFFAFTDLKMSRDIEDLNEFLLNRMTALVWLDEAKGPNLLLLPDLVILRIFAHLPLADLEKIHNLHLPWKQLQSEAQANRRSLTIILGNDPIRCKSVFEIPYKSDLLTDSGSPKFPKIDHEWDQLYINPLTEEATRDLMRKYPNLKRLEIHQIDFNDEASEFILITALLIKWSPNLVSLKLYATKYSIGKVRFCDKLLKMFQSYDWSSLKHLSCELATCSGTVDLPILGQLETFQFAIRHGDASLLQSLQKYADGNLNLQRIDLKISPVDQTHSREILQLNPGIAAKINCLDNMDLLLEPRLTHHQLLTGLTQTEFTLHEPNRSIGHITEMLSPLQSLTYFRFLAHNSELNTSTDPIVPLPSVTALSLRISSQDHDTLAGFELHLAFPNLQVIEIQNIKVNCETCNYRLDFTTGDDQLNECKRLQIKTLLRCKKLKSVYYPRNEYEVYRKVTRKIKWTVEDLQEAIPVTSTQGWRWLQPGVRILTSSN